MSALGACAALARGGYSVGNRASISALHSVRALTSLCVMVLGAVQAPAAAICVPLPAAVTDAYSFALFFRSVLLDVMTRLDVAGCAKPSVRSATVV